MAMPYLSLLALMLLVLSPVLVPLAVTAGHAFGNLRRTPKPGRTVTAGRRTVASSD